MAANKPKCRRVLAIMAGGSGERFWPLSRAKRPKQMLKLTSATETLLEEALNRALPVLSPEDIFVSTSKELAASIRKAGLPLPSENIVSEPHRRNTVGALCWLAARVQARYPGEEIALGVLTADHMIGQPARFRAKIKAALSVAEKNRALVTIGVKPTRPETGYGYIEVPKGRYKGSARPVGRFREKPNRELAEEFLESGRHYWNSGMFFWRISTFLDELHHASPEIAGITAEVITLLSEGKDRAAANAFAKLPNISIDYALMEKAENVLMVESNFPWDDVGAWDALDRSRSHDADDNVIEGPAVVIDSRSNIVINEAGHKVAVGVVGAENLIVIVSGDSVLVVPKSRAQDVRLVARELKKRGAPQI